MLRFKSVVGCHILSFIVLTFFIYRSSSSNLLYEYPFNVESFSGIEYSCLIDSENASEFVDINGIPVVLVDGHILGISLPIGTKYISVSMVISFMTSVFLNATYCLVEIISESIISTKYLSPFIMIVLLFM